MEGDVNVVLDGEMYADIIYGVKNKKTYEVSDEELDIKQKFDVISGAVRPVRKDPHPLEEQICYYVFDIADPSGKYDQDERFK